MIVRVGVEGGRRAVLARARTLGASILVSANSLWNDQRQRFSGWQCYTPFDVALDSGGFVAMKRYGRYRWSTRAYAGLAKSMQPTWWAQMDYCCEPELASDRATVRNRIAMTAGHLQELQRIATGEEIARPMPVLQGWHPEDYCHGPAFDEPFDWPALVGVGSVCRRPLHGRTGLMAVIEAIHNAVPRHVKLHLFGVKGDAIRKLLAEFPERIGSTDSMAWNVQARWDTRHSGEKRSSHKDADCMERWYRKHGRHAPPAQSVLGF